MWSTQQQDVLPLSPPSPVTMNQKESLGGSDNSSSGLGIRSIVKVNLPDSSAASEIDVEENLVVLGTSQDDKYSFDRVFGPMSSPTDLYETEVQSLVSSCMKGFNASILLVGESHCGRSRVLNGSGDPRTGLVHMVGEDLFQHIGHTLSAASDSEALSVMDRSRSRSSSKIRVSLRIFEVYNDTIHDLLLDRASKSRSDLYVSIGDTGPVIPRISTREIRSGEELVDVVESALSRRSKDSSDHGPFRNVSSLFIEMEIHQKVAPNFSDLISRFTLTILPGTEKLSDTIDHTRAAEGSKLNRELLSVVSVVKKLSQIETQQYTTYDLSITSSLLEDILGGNCVTL